tara:strand:+ start:2314 stop:2685 length:372 start_codon:yes stop_codon:yes gene_type:complete
MWCHTVVQKGEHIEKSSLCYTRKPTPWHLSAAKYGELIPLTSAFEQVHLSPEKTVAQIKRKLLGFGDDDYLLALGDPAIIGISFAIASNLNHGRVKLLKWDRQEKIYYDVKISLRHGIETIKT